MKRIAVNGDDSIDVQARTYAEYRVFAAVARHARNLRRVRVMLRHTDDHDVICVVTVGLEGGGALKIRVTAPHPYAAINRAVGRLRIALGRRVEQRLSS